VENGLISKKEEAFDEVIAIIEKARERAFRAVNLELINMYSTGKLSLKTGTRR